MGSIHNRIMEGHILDTLRCKKLTISRFWYLNYCNVIKRFSPYFVFVCYLFQLSNLKNSFTHQLLMPLEGKLTTALNLFSLLIFKNATLIHTHTHILVNVGGGPKNVKSLNGLPNVKQKLREIKGGPKNVNKFSQFKKIEIEVKRN